jgi:hypothetical protein
MSLTIAQKTNADGFAKAGELIEITGTSALEASDRAVLNLLYQHAHDSGCFAEPDAVFEVPITDLLHSSHVGTERVRESLARLLAIQVQVPIKHPRTGRPAVLMTHLFSSFVVPETAEPGNSATVRYRIPLDLLPVLLASNRWGRIKAAIVCAMASKYAIALYELVQLRAGMDRCVEVFPIARFRDLLGVAEGTYNRDGNLLHKVIEPAVLEVNALSDLGVAVEVRRRSLRAPIEAVAVTWWKKEGEPFREALRERERPKLGRRARLKAQIEAATPARPVG